LIRPWPIPSKSWQKNWYDQQDTLAETTKYLLLQRLKLDVFPVIGKIPVSELTPRLILEGVLRPMEKRLAEITG
jgi:hypothetical protein